MAEARGRGLTDWQLVERHPGVLALLPPAQPARAPLLATDSVTALPRGAGILPTREALRLRHPVGAGDVDADARAAGAPALGRPRGAAPVPARTSELGRSGARGTGRGTARRSRRAGCAPGQRRAARRVPAGSDGERNGGWPDARPP
jgi:hypothetical protein